ncbi:tripartite tricarboxylate transporter TctB family protein [Sporomusa sphaeroides DSM 2875]|jgi:putative tricarboxylic transport membrane protein|uniref:tripartite tricarboxylate transporter TctB family protein n=1 Tax=Sporomusa sphaeroides TaxID=47679 RepID=UPI002030A62C|nr:tripartite tricarboxylate transporter TctB family protein [Sporomusa sphaeroides]MCM0758705.1 tripartite tricarboxylate transporter TctB family protein [Sporomusa sphaeroides DSM 2875]
MAERLLSVFFLAISIGYTYYAGNLSFGSFMAPKAGFLPLLTGSIAICLALTIVIRSWPVKATGKTGNVNWRKLIFIIIGIVAYIIIMQLAGYLAATFIILFYLLKMAETPGWLTPGLFSAGIALSFYFIFEKFLGSKLP